MLSIVRRELQVAARKPVIYRQRLLIGGAAALVAFFCLIFSQVAPDKAGSAMFGILSWSVFLITILDCIRCAADSLSWERREGTLGLLFLANLRGYDVVLGKFSSAAAKAYTSLFVTFPILALPLMMGGITGGEWARTMLALATAGLFSLSAALMLSSISVGALTAMGGALAMVSVGMLAPILFAHIPQLQVVGFEWLSGPLAMFLLSEDFSFKTNPGTFWNAFFFSIAASVGMLMASCWLVNRPGSFEPRQKTAVWWKRFLEPRRRRDGKTSVGSSLDSPANWLAERTFPGRRLLRIVVILGAVASALVVAFGAGTFAVGVIITLQVSVCFLIKLWAGAVAPQSFHASKSCGALELLLCTPLRPAALIRGQMDSLIEYFRTPALVVCLGFPACGVLGGAIAAQNMKQMEGVYYTIIFGIFWFVVFLLDLYALAYTGLWNGLTSVKIEQAVARTVGYVIFLPWLTTLIPMAGFGGWIFWPVFWICWSSYKLNHKFKERVTEQFAHAS